MAGNLGNRWQTWRQEQLPSQWANGKQREGPGNDKSKLCSQSPPSGHRIHISQTSQTAPPSGDQASKHLSLCRGYPHSNHRTDLGNPSSRLHSQLAVHCARLFKVSSITPFCMTSHTLEGCALNHTVVSLSVFPTLFYSFFCCGGQGVCPPPAQGPPSLLRCLLHKGKSRSLWNNNVTPR